ncbi:hypothetical protein GCM10009788_00260 [Nocardioides humi]|uniref:Uncharacterized protein n=1 Tax=Nocardioides humi TaxID=449461 RepID=A0ABN1ZNS3_9ACTN
MVTRSTSPGAEAEAHAATLRATRDAHREAQAMLAVASQASEEAERVVLEAREAAERARQELADWAAAQRAQVDSLAADLAESAHHDADVIRAEALRTSMAEAEETARLYVAEAAVGAQRDAEEIRAAARAVLRRANELGEEVTEAIWDLTSAAAAVTTRLQGARAMMEQLLAEGPFAGSFDDADQGGDDRGDEEG